MAIKKDEQNFSIIDLFKGGIPNPAGYPVPIPPANYSNKKQVAEKSPDYKITPNIEKK